MPGTKIINRNWLYVLTNFILRFPHHFQFLCARHYFPAKPKYFETIR